MKQDRITLMMTTETLLVYLATRPIYEHGVEQKEGASAMCHTLLKHVRAVEDESQQIGIVASIYIVAQIMALEEILNNELLTLWLSQEDGEFKDIFPSDAAKTIGKLAQEDYKSYLHWISPFLLKAGVVDINSELEEIDVIQEALCGESS